jgi:hypothetical protein
MNNIHYMISSIIMNGAREAKTIDAARKIAQQEAKKLSHNKEYGNTKDGWVHIDKYNSNTHINTYLESWRMVEGKFMRSKS